MTLLEARRVGRMIEGRYLFRDLDLTVGTGERVAVMGPSGSGKSSLLALLAGLHRPDEGEVSFDGEPVTGLLPPRQGVSMILQGYGLVSVLTGTENVEIALLAAGRSPTEARRQALRALEGVGLAAVSDQLVDTLSGGQQQRTAVARALALQPRLLIADEPTAELDPVARSLVVALLTGASASGTALVLATHDPEVAETCDRIVDMRQNG